MDPIHNDVTKTKWPFYLGEICINVMETLNEPVLLDGCDLLNPEGTDLTSFITLKKAFRHISGGLSVPCSSSHEDLEVVSVDLAFEIKSITSSSNVFEDDANVDWFSDDLLVLTEADIPGSSLNGKEPSELNVVQLKKWLACRGAPVTGKKPQLVERYGTVSQLYIGYKNIAYV